MAVAGYAGTAVSEGGKPWQEVQLAPTELCAWQETQAIWLVDACSPITVGGRTIGTLRYWLLISLKLTDALVSEFPWQAMQIARLLTSLRRFDGVESFAMNVLAETVDESLVATWLPAGQLWRMNACQLLFQACGSWQSVHGSFPPMSSLSPVVPVGSCWK